MLCSYRELLWLAEDASLWTRSCRAVKPAHRLWDPSLVPNTDSGPCQVRNTDNFGPYIKKYVATAVLVPLRSNGIPKASKLESTRLSHGNVA